MLPVEQVEFVLNTALFPVILIAKIEIPDGRV
jgi:hypothetical protein